MKSTKIKVVKDPADEIAVEVVERSIVEVAASMRRINESRLTQKAIVALIHANSGIGKGQIEIILNNLSSLERIWLKPKAPK